MNTAIPKEFNTVTSDSIVTEHSENQTEDKPEEKIEVISTKTSKPQVVTPKPISTPKRVPIKWNYTTAKAAYRARSLSKADYKKIVYHLKIDYKKTIRQLKIDYQNEKITKVQYKQAVAKARKALEGQ